MATGVVSSANAQFLSTPYSSCSRRIIISGNSNSVKFPPAPAPMGITKRGLAISSLSLLMSADLWSNKSWNAAILEADDDVELLEKVKRDRKKRIERQEVINSSNKEAGYVQEIVYKLSKVGQAIEKNDLAAASSVLGSSTDADWVKKGNVAFTKLSANSEEKSEADVFNSSLASLISSVGKNDVDNSKAAFVSSASALEKWAALTGLAALLKGL